MRALIVVAENNGPLRFARIGMIRTLNRLTQRRGRRVVTVITEVDGPSLRLETPIKVIQSRYPPTDTPPLWCGPGDNSPPARRGDKSSGGASLLIALL
jgi:hypothetical protein